jgi:cytochrome P450
MVGGKPASIFTELYLLLSKSQLNRSDKGRHAFLRRIISPSFSPASLKAFETTIHKYLDEFIAGVQMADENEGGVEMNAWFHNLTFDVYPVPSH